MIYRISIRRDKLAIDFYVPNPEENTIHRQLRPDHLQIYSSFKLRVQNTPNWSNKSVMRSIFRIDQLQESNRST